MSVDNVWHSRLEGRCSFCPDPAHTWPPAWDSDILTQLNENARLGR
jgi:hypothetical protein